MREITCRLVIRAFDTLNALTDIGPDLGKRGIEFRGIHCRNRDRVVEKVFDLIPCGFGFNPFLLCGHSGGIAALISRTDSPIVDVFLTRYKRMNLRI